MSGLVQRVASWIANEIVVKKLSQSKGFQRMAARTVENIDKAESAIGNKGSQMARAKESVAKESGKFWESMKDEIRKDFQQTVGKPDKAIGHKGAQMTPAAKESAKKETGNFWEVMKEELKKDFDQTVGKK